MSKSNQSSKKLDVLVVTYKGESGLKYNVEDLLMKLGYKNYELEIIAIVKSDDKKNQSSNIRYIFNTDNIALKNIKSLAEQLVMYKTYDIIISYKDIIAATVVSNIKTSNSHEKICFIDKYYKEYKNSYTTIYLEKIYSKFDSIVCDKYTREIFEADFYSKYIEKIKELGNLEIKDNTSKTKENKVDTNNLIINRNKSENQIPDLNIGCILDPFTGKCYENVVNLIYLTPNNFKNEIDRNKIDMLFVESAWIGNNDKWKYKISKNSMGISHELINLIKYCKQKKIPTVFWNKEDPVHYENFIESAKLFDYIFTTDSGSISKYKRDVSHNNIYQLSFAANPYIHNPIKIYDNRIAKSCFAGTYYNAKYRERAKNLKGLLRLAIKYTGLDIYDRNYNKPEMGCKYPDEFNEYIKGYLDINEVDKANKGYKIALNVNSVKNSPTMFSRRVFECLACGTPVISSYSLGINELFRDIVMSSDNIDELKTEFTNLNSEEYYNQKAIKGIREVLNNHTYHHRITYVLKILGIDIKLKTRTVGVVSIVNSIQEFNTIIEMYKKQNYKNKRLYIFLNDESILDKIVIEDKSIKIILNDETNKNKSINKFISDEYICMFNYKNYYGKYYINDLINATLYSNADMIGKKSFYTLTSNKELYINNKNEEFKYVNNLDLDKSLIKIETIKNYKTQRLVIWIAKNSLGKVVDINSYLSIDRYNFIETTNHINSIEKHVEI